MISELHSLCRVDTTGLAASLPTLPVGLACHGRSSEHVGKNEMSLLTGGEHANVVRGDDLKVRPTECNGQMERMETEQKMKKIHFLVPNPKKKCPKRLGLVRATP